MYIMKKEFTRDIFKPIRLLLFQGLVGFLCFRIKWSRQKQARPRGLYNNSDWNFFAITFVKLRRRQKGRLALDTFGQQKHTRTRGTCA